MRRTATNHLANVHVLRRMLLLFVLLLPIHSWAAIAYVQSDQFVDNNTDTTVVLAYAPFRRLVIAEYSGAATSSPLDKTDSNLQEPASTGTDEVTSTAQTTTTNNQLIVGCMLALDGTPHTITAGTSFTVREDTNSDAQVVLEDRILASAGSVAATFTIGNAVNTLAVMATFKAVGGVDQTFGFRLRRPQ